MLSKNKIKFLSSLSFKKFRESNGVFLAEGEKIVSEILFSKNTILQPEELFATEDYLKSISDKSPESNLKITTVLREELKKISVLSTPNNAALLLRIPTYKPEIECIKNSISIILEDIRDPGNLGTIIRTADWFGIRNIFCSNESVDLFNPKTVQSTMGAIARVNVHYTDIPELLQFYNKNYGVEIIGALLSGVDIREKPLPEKAMLVFGNESHGISDKINSLLTSKLTIPSFNTTAERTESLNVASSVAIFCWEMQRTQMLIRNEN